MSADRKHRRYSPSQMERLAACPGSDKATVGVVRRDSVWSVEGTLAHSILQTALENRVRDARVAHLEHSMYCMTELDEAYGGQYSYFYYSVQTCLDYVFDILDDNPHAVMWIETFVDPPSEVAPGETGGYCDICIYDPMTGWLWVIDFKHGAGVAKAARGNKQLKQYGAGFLYDPNSPMYGKDVSNVRLVIVQPRAFHVEGDIRYADHTAYSLYEYLDEMDKIVAACQSPTAPLIPEDLSDKHTTRQCQFCPINTTCPAREAHALQRIDATLHTVGDALATKLPVVQNLDVERLEYLAQHFDTLRAWMKSVENRLYELAREGHPLTRHKLVEAQARRRWYGDADYVATQLAALTGLPASEFYTMTLGNITDIEKVVVKAYKERAPRGHKKDAAEDAKKAMAYLTLKDTSGNLTLVSVDDARPAVDRASVAFQNVGAALAQLGERDYDA